MGTNQRKLIDYELIIHTADRTYAGTDNNVYITVYGIYDNEEVQTGEINLSNRVSGNAFERDDRHSLTFQWEDIGRPTKIRLRLSNDLLDDWCFDYCTIRRKGTETEEQDPEINKLVTFKGDKWFERKDSHIFYGDLGELQETIISATEFSDTGGTEFLTLSSGDESRISMTFAKEEINSIEKSSIIQNGQSHSVDLGIEGGYSAGSQGGWNGKAAVSYGFSYSTLKTLSETNSQKVTDRYSKETSIIVRAKEDTKYAIVYEMIKLKIERKREGATTYTVRTDVVNLGRRVRAVLALTFKDGRYVYIHPSGKVYEENKLWDAVK